MRSWLLGLCVAALSGCGSVRGDGGGGGAGPTALAPLVDVKLTDQATLAPTHAVSSPAESRKPSSPEDRASLLADGFGDNRAGKGEAHVTRVAGGTTAPAPGANPKLLVRLAHMPDFQLADDESPNRLCAFDTPGATNAALRPQDVDLCRMLNAAVRTLNGVHDKTPLDFVLLGGDNADSAQENELAWTIGVLSGDVVVECDSGDDDDPVKGADNDGKDPFAAVGLAVPWRWVTGNHDVLVQGNLPVSQINSEKAIGDQASGGTRDWSQPGGPVLTGEVKPDADRRLLTRKDVMSRVAFHGDGHGLGEEQVQSGKATYTFDVTGTPLRFLILDTAAETGGSEGVIHQADVDALIRPKLEQAVTDGKWVILASHHAVTSLGDGTGLGGVQQADALTQDQWLDVVGGFPNVLFSIVGHTHEHRITLTAPPAGGHGWWEVMTSALADWPHEQRVVEIWDEDNGWVHLHTTLVDFRTDDDAVAAEGRQLGTLDYTSGWSRNGNGTADDRNADLWIARPAL